MFLTLTPNPCIERTQQISGLAIGETQRLDSTQVQINAGGKGLNAARVAARFGADVLALAPVGRNQRDWLCTLTQNEGIKTDFVEVEADTRFCFNFLHENGQKTEFIDNGICFSASEGAQLLEKWRDFLPKARLASIGGSYAPSTDPAFHWHATLICALAASAGVPLIYDGTGEPFKRALASKTPPWAIKPNLEEAAAILNRTLESPEDERGAIRDFLRRGVEVVLLSCGERGLYVGHREGIEWFEAPRVQVISAVGSGDALVGAFAARWLQNANLFEAAQWGVAAGSANATQQKSAFVTPGDAKYLLSQVKRTTREITLRLSS